MIAASDGLGQVSRQPQPKIALADTKPRRSNGIQRALLPLATANGARRQQRSLPLLVRIDNRHRPPRFFLRGQQQLKKTRSPTAPMLSHTHGITINLFDEKARNPETSLMAQQNSGRNAQGVRGDGRNIKTQQSTRWGRGNNTLVDG